MLEVIDGLGSLNGVLLAFLNLLFGFGSFLLLVLGLVFCVFPGSPGPFEDLGFQLVEEPLVDERVSNLVSLGLNINNVRKFGGQRRGHHSAVLTDVLLNFLIS